MHFKFPLHVFVSTVTSSLNSIRFAHVRFYFHSFCYFETDLRFYLVQVCNHLSKFTKIIHRQPCIWCITSIRKASECTPWPKWIPKADLRFRLIRVIFQISLWLYKSKLINKPCDFWTNLLISFLLLFSTFFAWGSLCPRTYSDQEAL